MTLRLRRVARAAAPFVALALSSVEAFAHSGHPTLGAGDSFLAGFLHPLTGPDHIAAMTAVGLWAALCGGARLWVWPLTFMAFMLGGGVLGYLDVPLPHVEAGIAASVLILGLLIAGTIRGPLFLGAALIAVFAILHGHAHGSELAGSQFGGYAAGFTLATGLLHLVGIGLGIGLQRLAGSHAVRVVGALVAGTGAYLFAS